MEKVLVLMKKFLFSLCFVVSLVGSVAIAGTPKVHQGHISAIVNDRAISGADLRHRVYMALLSSGMPRNPETIAQLSPQILQMMIDEVLQRELGDRYKITVSDLEIDTMIQGIEEQNQFGKGGLKRLLESNGVPMGVMRDHLKARHIWQEYIKAKYQGNIVVTDGQVANHMAALKRIKNKPHYHLAEIYLPILSNADGEKVAKDARVLHQKIQAGARFSAIAQGFSRVESMAQGGDMGWVTLDSLDPQVASAVAALTPGKVSAPIRVKGGYYIVKLLDTAPDASKVGKETYLSFQQALFQVNPNGGQEALESVYHQAERYRQKAKSCKAVGSLLSGIKGVKLQTVNRAPMSRMPAELQKLLLSLKEGGSSRPVLTPEGFMVFWLCSKEDYTPHDPKPEEVKAMLMDQKLSVLAKREAKNLRRGAVITIKDATLARDAR